MTLISKILTLLALVIVMTGCAQFVTPPDETADSSSVTTPAITPEEQPPAPAVQPDVADTSASDDTTDDTSVESVEQQPEPADIASETPAEPEPDMTTREPAGIDVPVAPADGQEDAMPVAETGPVIVQSDVQERQVNALCNEIGNKLGSVSVADCLAQPLMVSGGYTVQGRPMVVRDFDADTTAEEGTRVLILGGIHGDEYSSISIMFKWMEILEQSSNRDFQWRFAPTVNPDGLLDGQAVRQNANGVDLNRNFPSEDWLDLAEDYWNNSTSRNPLRYPGTHPASEPEVQWIVEQIESYKPDVIVSVHAPYHLLDYDGPPEAPEQIGELHLHLLGVYPGSLGNYAGINLGIPVVTMELPSAGIMPSDEQIVSMWVDLLQWLYDHHES